MLVQIVSFPLTNVAERHSNIFFKLNVKIWNKKLNFDTQSVQDPDGLMYTKFKNQ